jgi:hypothetical protein
MMVEDLLDDASRRSYAASPEMDALTEPGALQEAQLIAARLDAVRSQAWLLIDCRGALQIRMGNTAIIIAKVVRRFAWQAKPAGAPTAWTIVGSEPAAKEGVWSLSLTFVPEARLELEAESAEFFVGNVPGGDDASPDFGAAADEAIRAGLPGWRSVFEPVHAVFLDPADAS